MKNNFLLIILILLLQSCFDDKGNYDYEELDNYEIEGVNDVISVLADAEHINFSISVKNLETNKIQDNTDLNFTVLLGVETKDRENIWTDINKDLDAEVDTLADFKSGQYKLWIEVRKKNSNELLAFCEKTVKVSSITYEGWMILCNEGIENRCRMDMVSVVSSDRVICAYDIMSNKGLPESKNAYGLGFRTNYYSDGDYIYIINEDNAYKLNKDNFETNTENTINNIKYLIPTDEFRPVCYYALEYYGTLIITKDGDAYGADSKTGSCYAAPLNVDVIGGKPTFKVSPMVGVNLSRPIKTDSQTAILYDITNERFIGWNTSNNKKDVLFKLVNSENALFDYSTGRELVWMGGTSYNKGAVYAILKEGVKRYVYGISVELPEPKQFFYDEIKVDNIDKAENFAFHSLYPFMYYSVGNNIYSYDLQKKENKIVATLPQNEKITLIKFNLWGNDISSRPLNNMDEEFISMQYQLVVGSYNKSDEIKGGKFRLFKVNNTENALTKVKEYDGFAKIVDVVYRERREK